MTYPYYNSSRPAARSTSSDLKQFDTFVLLFLLFTFRKIQICCLMMLYNQIKAKQKIDITYDCIYFILCIPFDDFFKLVCLFVH